MAITAQLLHVPPHLRILHAHKPGVGEPVWGNTSEGSQAGRDAENSRKRGRVLSPLCKELDSLAQGLGSCSYLDSFFPSEGRGVASDDETR